MLLLNQEYSCDIFHIDDNGLFTNACSFHTCPLKCTGGFKSQITNRLFWKKSISLLIFAMIPWMNVIWTFHRLNYSLLRVFVVSWRVSSFTRFGFTRLSTLLCKRYKKAHLNHTLTFCSQIIHSSYFILVNPFTKIHENFILIVLQIRRAWSVTAFVRFS